MGRAPVVVNLARYKLLVRFVIAIEIWSTAHWTWLRPFDWSADLVDQMPSIWPQLTRTRAVRKMEGFLHHDRVCCRRG